jgi:hypothetical protein
VTRITSINGKKDSIQPQAYLDPPCLPDPTIRGLPVLTVRQPCENPAWLHQTETRGDDPGNLDRHRIFATAGRRFCHSLGGQKRGAVREAFYSRRVISPAGEGRGTGQAGEHSGKKRALNVGASKCKEATRRSKAEVIPVKLKTWIGQGAMDDVTHPLAPDEWGKLERLKSREKDATSFRARGTYRPSLEPRPSP